MLMCFDLHGQQICVRVPTLRQPFQIGPIPEEGPTPVPWLVLRGLDRELLQQAVAASTIAGVLQHLPQQHQNAIRTALVQVGRSIEEKAPPLKVKWSGAAGGPDHAVSQAV